MIRTSFNGLVTWFLVSGGLALVGLASAETDDVCGSWGYVVKDAVTCETSGGAQLARFGGTSCALAGVSLGWAFFKAYRANRSFQSKW